jgi:SMC interacting uncharacterized protein involved in chromosome segregation
MAPDCACELGKAIKSFSMSRYTSQNVSLMSRREKTFLLNKVGSANLEPNASPMISKSKRTTKNVLEKVDLFINSKSFNIQQELCRVCRIIT